MAKGSLTSKEDAKKIRDASAKGSAGYIKIKNGKNFIRFLSSDAYFNHVHPIKMKDGYREYVCLCEGSKSPGYAPDTCPLCKIAKEEFWDKIKELKESGSKGSKAQIALLTNQGKKFQTRFVTKMIAIYGEAVRERENGKVYYVPEWEKEAKIISLSSSQQKQIDPDSLEEKYDFFKRETGYTDRNFIFAKEAEKGEEIQANTPIKITPETTKSKSPKFDGELPDMENVFTEKTYEELEEIGEKLLGEIGKDDDDEVEERSSKKKTSKDDLEDDDDSDDDDEDDDDFDSDDSDEDDDNESDDEDEEDNDESDFSDSDDDDEDDESDDDDEEEEEKPKKKTTVKKTVTKKPTAKKVVKKTTKKKSSKEEF